MIPYKSPNYSDDAFNCPFCNAYAKQVWTQLGGIQGGRSNPMLVLIVDDVYLATCDRCGQTSIWVRKLMVYPNQSIAPLPNADMPDDLRSDYEEARAILSLSPRGAAALLRLVLQKLCVHLGEKGKDLNDDIKCLVAKGLPVRIQQALDTVRVVGNNAVHPGVIDLKDDIELASKLFVLINIVCDVMITQPKAIEEIYSSRVPESAKDTIRKRDGV